MKLPWHPLTRTLSSDEQILRGDCEGKGDHKKKKRLQEPANKLIRIGHAADGTQRSRRRRLEGPRV